MVLTEDDIDKSQDIANYTGGLLEDRTKGMVGKEVTEDTLTSIRNNKNVITGEEGKQLAENIPMDRREYVKWGRVFKGIGVGFFGAFRAGVAYVEIGLGGPVGWTHGTAQGFFGISEFVEGLDHIRLGAMDIDEEEKPAFSLSKKLLGDKEEFINFAVGMTTEEAVVYAQTFTKMPNLLKTNNNKSLSGSDQNLEKGYNGSGIEVSVEDSTAIKTVSNNENVVNQTGNNSKEIALYEDKNSKITIDVKDISTGNSEVTDTQKHSAPINNSNKSNTINEIKAKSWTASFEKKAIQVYNDFKKKGLETSSHFVARFLNRKNQNLTQDKVIEIYKEKPINYIEKVPDKNSPSGYKTNNVRYYDNIRVVTNETDTELITVVEDKNNQASKNIDKKKWEEVK